MNPKKKYFFGWQNIKFIITEFIKMLSSEKSFFSQKRFQQFTAFGVVIWGCVYWLVKHGERMDTGDFLLWATIPVSIASYTLYHVQKQKPPLAMPLTDKTDKSS